ncbi:MAG: ECF transporter S component [Ruminococcaceae bacterium]|nr:ECF transporter S component [Oscillospiraceae bacterium]
MRKFWNVQNKVLRLVLLALFTAAIAVTTAYLSIPNGFGGYIHLGDGIIFMSAMLLGPAGAISAGVGSGLADLLVGYGMYAPVTLVIKCIMGLLVGCFYSRKGNAMSFLVNIGLFILAEVVMVVGYFGYEVILYGFEGALAGVPANAIQAVAGIAIGAVFTPFVKKIKL